MFLLNLYVLLAINLSRDVTDSELWFDEKAPSRSFRNMLAISKLYAKESGFLRNGDLIIVAELDALEVIGASIVSVKSEPRSKVEEKSWREL